MKGLISGAALVIFCATATVPLHAEQAGPVNPDKMKWMPVDIVPGTEATVLSGDPAKPGFFVMEWRGPTSIKMAPHWHSNTEQLVVVSGSALVGMSDKVDLQKGARLGPGGYVEAPGQMHHWFATQGPFVAIVEGNGPFDIHFVNPEDDPRNKASKQ